MSTVTGIAVRLTGFPDRRSTATAAITSSPGSTGRNAGASATATPSTTTAASSSVLPDQSRGTALGVSASVATKPRPGRQRPRVSTDSANIGP